MECNICSGTAQNPVVTLCGHLHCWPCLNERLRLNSQSHECPVCKAVIKEEHLIPLHGSDNTTFHQRLVGSGGLLWRRRGFIPVAQVRIRVPSDQSVRARLDGQSGGVSGYGSFGEGGGNGERGVPRFGNNLNKILILILVFVVFDFLII